MKTYNISSGPIKSEIILPRSKSYANRILILAALSKKETVIEDLPEVDDVKLLLEALIKIGVKVKSQDNKHYIFGNFPQCALGVSPIKLNVGEGGTTARFLATMLSLDSHEYEFEMSGKLANRPWEELIDALKSLGANATLTGNILKIQGPVKFETSKLEVSAKRSTQFASALKLAFSQKIEIVPTDLSASISYWKLTADLVEKFKTSDHFTIPIDWSGASYPLCFAALTQETSFPGLHYDLHQADSKLFDILNKLGAIKTVNNSGMVITPIKDRVHSLKINVEDCLDLVPALSFLLAHLEGTHELSGVSNLIHKESDRLNEVIRLLGEFEREAVYISESDTLKIIGHNKLINDLKTIKTEPDHRLVMTASLFLKLHQGGNLAYPEAVQKSFNDYFQVCGV